MVAGTGRAAGLPQAGPSRAGLLRLYRWLALAFALPLLAVIGSGLLLALEPIAHQAALRPGTLTADGVDGLRAPRPARPGVVHRA